MSCTRWVKNYVNADQSIFDWVAMPEEHEPLGEVEVDTYGYDADSRPLDVNLLVRSEFSAGFPRHESGRLCVCKHCKLVYWEPGK